MEKMTFNELIAAGRSESTCIVLGPSVPAYTPGPEETAEFLELLEKSATVIKMSPIADNEKTAGMPDQQIFPPYTNEELEEILDLSEFHPSAN